MDICLPTPPSRKLIGALLAVATMSTAGVATVAQLAGAERNGQLMADPFYCLVITDPQGKPIKTVCFPKPIAAPAEASVS